MKFSYKSNLEELVGEGLLMITDSTGVSGPSASSSSTGIPFFGFSLLRKAQFNVSVTIDILEKLHSESKQWLYAITVIQYHSGYTTTNTIIINVGSLHFSKNETLPSIKIQIFKIFRISRLIYQG